MYVNLKPNKHRISFNTTTMASLGFIGPPKILGPLLNLALSKFNFLLRSSSIILVWNFYVPPLKLGGCCHEFLGHFFRFFRLLFQSFYLKNNLSLKNKFCNTEFDWFLFQVLYLSIKKVCYFQLLASDFFCHQNQGPHLNFYFI